MPTRFPCSASTGTMSSRFFSTPGKLAFDDASPFYYRILSPVILVEFDHQSGIIYNNDTPSRDHIHTVVRTPNGNDYGKDLLRQHYAEHDHSHPTTAHHHRTA